MSKIAWIGLGVMGYPLAGHLKMRGHHDVVVFNRTRKRADAWVATSFFSWFGLLGISLALSGSIYGITTHGSLELWNAQVTAPRQAKFSM